MGCDTIVCAATETTLASAANISQAVSIDGTAHGVQLLRIPVHTCPMLRCVIRVAGESDWDPSLGLITATKPGKTTAAPSLSCLRHARPAPSRGRYRADKRAQTPSQAAPPRRGATSLLQRQLHLLTATRSSGSAVAGSEWVAESPLTDSGEAWLFPPSDAAHVACAEVTLTLTVGSGHGAWRRVDTCAVHPYGTTNLLVEFPTIRQV